MYIKLLIECIILSATDTISHSWTPEEVCKELSIIEQSLEVRKTLFEAVREWSVLEKEWSESPLKTLKVEALQKKANTFVHTIDYLERGEEYFIFARIFTHIVL